MYDAEIKFRRIYENPMTGLSTWELQDMEYLEFLSNIVRKEGSGKDIVSTARNGRINAKNRFTFHSGGGYDVIDMDLLDGNGNGERSHILDRKYNIYISREYK